MNKSIRSLQGAIPCKSARSLAILSVILLISTIFVASVESQSGPSSSPAADGSRQSGSSTAKKIIVYLAARPQKIALYEGTTLVGVYKVSCGTTGHETPTGTFTVIAKNATAWSRTYNCGMPFALRLGNPYDGYNLHFNPSVPDRPASHGCMREHFKTSIIVFEWATVGTTVIITNEAPPASLPTTVTYNAAYTRSYYKLGDVDPGVKVIQRGLVAKGFLNSTDVTGTYNQKTFDAVKSFQRSKGLTVDGKAGIVTTQKLLSHLNRGW